MNDENYFMHYARKTMEWLEQKNIKKSPKLIVPQMCLRPEPLKVFGLCWLVQFVPKDRKQMKLAELCGRIKRKLKEIDAK
jgi:hypothetical protein